MGGGDSDPGGTDGEGGGGEGPRGGEGGGGEGGGDGGTDGGGAGGGAGRGGQGEGGGGGRGFKDRKLTWHMVALGRVKPPVPSGMSIASDSLLAFRVALPQSMYLRSTRSERRSAARPTDRS